MTGQRRALGGKWLDEPRLIGQAIEYHKATATNHSGSRGSGECFVFGHRRTNFRCPTKPPAGELTISLVLRQSTLTHGFIRRRIGRNEDCAAA